MPVDLVISDQLVIPAAELQWQFARSSGPGGQNVNKVNTKAVLRWRPADSSALSAGVQQRFLQRYGGRLNQRGEIVLASDQHREQLRNVEQCRKKLRGMIVAVLHPPRPRVRTRRTRASIERRLQSKRHQSQRKQQRRYRPGEE